MARRNSQEVIERVTALETRFPYLEKAVEELVRLTRDVPELRRSIDNLTRYFKIGITMTMAAFLHLGGVPLAENFGSLVASLLGIPQ